MTPAPVAWTRRYEEAEPQRVNRWLAQSGVCSRREADALIAEGLVSIDGARVDDAGRKIAPGQTLALCDRAAEGLAARVTAVLNKPVGFVSGQPEPGHTPAVRLVTADRLTGPGEAPARDAALPPLGRLDEDSRGLLLLSDDGVLAKAVVGPASQLDKEYLVRVGGTLTRDKLELLRHGLELDGRALRPAKVALLADEATLRITLSEGRNRQIRRMCEAVRLWVLDLHRVRIGPLRLGDLPEGRWRMLTPQEREALIAASTGKSASPQTETWKRTSDGS